MKQRKPHVNPDFEETLQQIKHLTRDKKGDNSQKFFKFQSTTKDKNQKMPLKMLTGLRKKIISKYQADKQTAKEENVQHDSSNVVNSYSFVENFLKNKKKRKVTEDFNKNKYKFKELKTKKVGNFKNGQMTFSKKDLKKLL